MPVNAPTLPAPPAEIVSPPADPLGPAQNPVAASAWAFAPYIDVVANNGLTLMQQAIDQGVRYFNLAFVQSDASGNPFWGQSSSATTGPLRRAAPGADRASPESRRGRRYLLRRLQRLRGRVRAGAGVLPGRQNRRRLGQAIRASSTPTA